MEQNMEVLMGPQPLVRPVFSSVGNQLETMDTEEYAEKTEREENTGSCEGTEYERKDYVEINFRDTEGSNSPTSCDESRHVAGNYRSELKRPDLKGSFRCSICSKVFCHSSSLSRHRMQAHFKSYKCTLCRKDITSNETLRAHMYKQHQISRMFMCRCCNWAFPDKTSLHMHIQAREEGKQMGGPIIGKGMSSEGMDQSAFAPLHPIPSTHSLSQMPQMPPMPQMSQLPNSVLPPAPMPFFAPPSPLATSQDELNRLRERLMLNSLMAQQGFGMPWLNQLPKPVPTTRPLEISPSVIKNEELVINVEKESTNTKQDDDEKLNVSGSDSDEPKPESCRVSKRSDSPCENGSASSTDGSSPCHTSSAHSPVNLFKKDRTTPSAFHHLNVDSRPFGVSPSHVSPSETHSSISPDGGCFECAVYKTKLTMADNKCRYLESRANTLQTEAVRAQSQTAQADTAIRVLEGETRALREHTEHVQRRLLDCQEQALRFVQSDRTSNPQAVIMFLNQLIQSTIIR